MGRLKAGVLFLRAMLVPKVHLVVENLALRQQLAVLGQSVKRPKLRPRDRVFWVWCAGPAIFGVTDLRSQPHYHVEVMLIFKGCRDKLSLGGQDAQQEQAAADPTPQKLGADTSKPLSSTSSLWPNMP
jgi:hypothetical protein